MATVWLRLRADLRLRWRALAGLALLLGHHRRSGAGRGRRRPPHRHRLPPPASWANAAQVDIITAGTGLTGYYAALARLPQVAAISTGVLYQTALPARHGVPELVNAFSSPDRALGVSADRVKVLQGQMFGPRAPGQAVIDPQLASQEHLRPGGTLHLLGIPDTADGLPELAGPIPLAFRVTAIGVFDTEIVPTNITSAEPTCCSARRSTPHGRHNRSTITEMRPACGCARARA